MGVVVVSYSKSSDINFWGDYGSADTVQKNKLKDIQKPRLTHITKRPRYKSCD